MTNYINKEHCINTWYNEIKQEFPATENYFNLFKQLNEINKFHIHFIKDKGEDKGVFCYTFEELHKDNKHLSELFFYIKKEFRGETKLLLNTIKTIETIAKDNNCKAIIFGSNIGYKDPKLLNILKQKFNYQDYSIIKEL